MRKSIRKFLEYQLKKIAGIPGGVLQHAPRLLEELVEFPVLVVGNAIEQVSNQNTFPLLSKRTYAVEIILLVKGDKADALEDLTQAVENKLLSLYAKQKSIDYEKLELTAIEFSYSQDGKKIMSAAFKVEIQYSLLSKTTAADGLIETQFTKNSEINLPE